MHQSYIHPDTARLLQSLRALGGPTLRSLALADARSAAIAMTQQLDLPCTAACSVTAVAIDGQRTIPARLYAPIPEGLTDDTDAAPSSVIIYVHGGGWVLGDLDICDPLCRHLATRSGYRVLSPDYRLAPEHPFPAAFEDVEATVRWVARSPTALGLPVTGIAMAGDSAGGGLVAAAGLTYANDAPVPLLALLMMYPVTDISRTTPSYDRFAEGYVLEAADMHYFADSYTPTAAARSDPRVSPLLATSVAAMPPTTLLTCGLDVLRDEGRAFAARLALAGVDISYSEARGHVHGIATMRGAVASARIPIDLAIDDFLRHMRRPPPPIDSPRL
jgi:acetyl esterase